MAKISDTIDVQAVAEIVGAHPETVRRLARKGKIPCFKMGRDWRFSRAAIDKWTGAQTQRPAQLKILVADDNQRVRATLKAILEREDYQVVEAANGAEAVELAFESKPDIVILDLKMPVMNGAEALCLIRKSCPTLPVIILTAYPDSELMNIAMKSSPFLLQEKPADRAQILNGIGMLTGKTPHFGVIIR